MTTPYGEDVTPYGESRFRTEEDDEVPWQQETDTISDLNTQLMEHEAVEFVDHTLVRSSAFENGRTVFDFYLSPVTDTPRISEAGYEDSIITRSVAIVDSDGRIIDALLRLPPFLDSEWTADREPITVFRDAAEKAPATWHVYIPYPVDEGVVRPHIQFDPTREHAVLTVSDVTTAIDEFYAAYRDNVASSTDDEAVEFPEPNHPRTTNPQLPFPDELYVQNELSDLQVTALQDYVVSMYKDVNRALRGAEAPDDLTKEYIQFIEEAVQNAPPFAEPGLVYRGLRGDRDLLRWFEEAADRGWNVQLRGFQSCTVDPEVVDMFLGGEKGQLPFIFEIWTGHGLPLFADDRFVYRGWEREVLLGHNWTYRVHRVVRNPDIPWLAIDAVLVQLEVVDI